jgi:hypothetical protein
MHYNGSTADYQWRVTDAIHVVDEERRHTTDKGHKAVNERQWRDNAFRANPLKL